jgi:hypothetical protein
LNTSESGERGHQEAGKVESYADHARVYLGQILDKSFTEGTTVDFRRSQVAGFVRYTINSYVQDVNNTDAYDMINQFNEKNKVGFKLTPNGGVGDATSLEVTISSKEGKSTIKYEKMSSPN